MQVFPQSGMADKATLKYASSRNQTVSVELCLGSGYVEQASLLVLEDGLLWAVQAGWTGCLTLPNLPMFAGKTYSFSAVDPNMLSATLPSSSVTKVRLRLR